MEPRSPHTACFLLVGFNELFRFLFRDSLVSGSGVSTVEATFFVSVAGAFESCVLQDVVVSYGMEARSMLFKHELSCQNGTPCGQYSCGAQRKSRPPS